MKIPLHFGIFFVGTQDLRNFFKERGLEVSSQTILARLQDGSIPSERFSRSGRPFRAIHQTSAEALVYPYNVFKKRNIARRMKCSTRQLERYVSQGSFRVGKVLGFWASVTNSIDTFYSLRPSVKKERENFTDSSSGSSLKNF